VHIGQKAVMRFSNFNTRTTPEIDGEVMVVSGDVTQDQRTGLSFYTVRIGVSPQELARLGEQRLVPGMPVEIFIQTTERTVVSFIVRPFQDQLARAFREK
jgi:HlyD family secretion protein